MTTFFYSQWNSTILSLDFTGHVGTKNCLKSSGNRRNLVSVIFLIVLFTRDFQFVI